MKILVFFPATEKNTDLWSNQWMTCELLQKNTKQKQILIGKKQKRAVKARRGRLTAFLDLILVPHFCLNILSDCILYSYENSEFRCSAHCEYEILWNLHENLELMTYELLEGKNTVCNLFGSVGKKTQISRILMDLWPTNFYYGNEIRSLC